MMQRSWWLLAVALAVVPVAPAQAQVDLGAVLDGMTWREIGPTIMGGRIADLAVVESNPSIFYVGTATGGLWKTTNHGTTFTLTFRVDG